MFACSEFTSVLVDRWPVTLHLNRRCPHRYLLTDRVTRLRLESAANARET
jgi:hypothetical protein